MLVWGQEQGKQCHAVATVAGCHQSCDLLRMGVKWKNWSLQGLSEANLRHLEPRVFLSKVLKNVQGFPNRT